MIVNLIGREKKYKIELPQEIEGSYWIVNDENGKKLINENAKLYLQHMITNCCVLIIC